MTCYVLCRMTKFSINRFIADEGGATAIEYGLMVSLIGLAIIGVVFSIGQGIKDTLYGRITNALATM